MRVVLGGRFIARARTRTRVFTYFIFNGHIHVTHAIVPHVRTIYIQKIQVRASALSSWVLMSRVLINYSLAHGFTMRRRFA